MASTSPPVNSLPVTSLILANPNPAHQPHPHPPAITPPLDASWIIGGLATPRTKAPRDLPDPVIERRAYDLEDAPDQLPMSRFPMESTLAGLDLRCVEYVEDYEIHIECLICRVPMLDPLRLECSHHFCRTCIYQSRGWQPQDDPLKRTCPACRCKVFDEPTYADRIITNICNDVKVKCPNKGCDETLARSVLEDHMIKYCPDMILPCPDVRCRGKVTRRHLHGENICRHFDDAETYYCDPCECGKPFAHVIIDEHKLVCPASSKPCQRCGHPLNTPGHIPFHCKPLCVGADFGCTTRLVKGQEGDHEDWCVHAKTSRNVEKMIERKTEPLTREIERLKRTINDIEAPMKEPITELWNKTLYLLDENDDFNNEVVEITAHMERIDQSLDQIIDELHPVEPARRGRGRGGRGRRRGGRGGRGGQNQQGQQGGGN